MARKQTEPRPMPEVWLSLEQAADLLGVPRPTLRRRALDGDSRLPAYQVWDAGNHTPVQFRFKKSDVDAFQALMATQDGGAREA
jgi:excisionase family DNA binding protein